MDLIFASHNQHKLQEVRASLGARHKVTSLAEIHFAQEIPETSGTLLGNARLKARAVFEQCQRDCFADDTGLEIHALSGEPGVKTARFAGDMATAQQNRDKTLSLMLGKADRRATFRTIIVLILNGEEFIFDGEVAGEITTAETGTDGFGYDPIFRPAGFQQSYAEMPLELRARISHRAQALQKMLQFLETHPAIANTSGLNEAIP